MKRCAVLFVNPEYQESAHPAYLRELGFLVDEIHEWPNDDYTVRDYHAVVIRVREISGAPMLAARLRAKPHFDRCVLVALVPADATFHERRVAEDSGFDDVVSDYGESRELSARLLRGLRARPDLRCALPPSLHRSSAA